MNVMNKPIPTAMADMMESGMASTNLLRIPNSVRIRKNNPEINTAPRAVCQSIFPEMSRVAKKAFSPIPGAIAMGALATTPTIIVAMPLTRHVTAMRACLSIRSTPVNSMPSRLRMDGFTKMM